MKMPRLHHDHCRQLEVNDVWFKKERRKKKLKIIKSNTKVIEEYVENLSDAIPFPPTNVNRPFIQKSYTSETFTQLKWRRKSILQKSIFWKMKKRSSDDVDDAKLIVLSSVFPAIFQPSTNSSADRLRTKGKRSFYNHTFYKYLYAIWSTLP